MKQKKNTLVLVALLVLGLVLSGLGYRALTQKQSSMDAPPTQQGEREPVMLPGFTVEDGSGNPVTSADFAGKPTVINFWATWCGYCVDEMPDFQTAYDTYGEEINFVMLNATDGQRETRAIADEYVEEYGFTFPVYYDTTLEAVRACGVTGYPATLFVSAEGEVLSGKMGRILADELNQTLESMLQ